MPKLTKTSVLCWGGFLLCIAYYFGVGASPIGHFKGDGTSMATGSLQIMQHGWDGPKVDYGRKTRPGIFWTLIALRAATGANPYLLFSLLTLAAGLAFVVVSAMFVARFTTIPLPLGGILILILFPDSSTWACYPNGTAVAGCLGMMALYLLARAEQPGLKTLAVAGILAGMAILARLDAVLLGLASVPLLYTANLRQTLCKLIIFGGIAVAVTLAGLYVSDCNVFDILHTSHSVLSKPSAARPAQGLVMALATNEAFTACAAAFPLLTLLLIALGTFQLLAGRQWRVLLIVAAGMLPVLLFYGKGIYGSPLYYTIPLFALLALWAVQEFPHTGRQAKLWLGGACLLLFLVQYPLGINVSLRSKPFFPVASPTLLCLGEKTFPGGPVSKVSLGIGPGGAVANTEGVRFCSGLMFHPLAFHDVKQQLLDAFRKMKDCVESYQADRPGLLVYTSAWASAAQVNMALQDLGYSCDKRGDVPCTRYVWKRGDREVVQITAVNVLDPWNHPELFAGQPPRQHVLYVTAGGRARSSVEGDSHVTKVLSGKAVIPSEYVCVFEVRL
jgi:hypothetical protein